MLKTFKVINSSLLTEKGTTYKGYRIDLEMRGTNLNKLKDLSIFIANRFKETDSRSSIFIEGYYNVSNDNFDIYAHKYNISIRSNNKDEAHNTYQLLKFYKRLYDFNYKGKYKYFYEKSLHDYDENYISIKNISGGTN